MNSFRKYIALFCITILLPTSAFANFLVVTPEQVSVSGKSLAVCINGVSIAVESLNAANDGYIVAIPVTKDEPQTCPKCGYDTYTPGRTCSTCGFPIWDEKKSA